MVVLDCRNISIRVSMNMIGSSTIQHDFALSEQSYSVNLRHSLIFQKLLWSKLEPDNIKPCVWHSVDCSNSRYSSWNLILSALFHTWIQRKTAFWQSKDYQSRSDNHNKHCHRFSKSGSDAKLSTKKTNRSIGNWQFGNLEK